MFYINARHSYVDYSKRTADRGKPITDFVFRVNYSLRIDLFANTQGK